MACYYNVTGMPLSFSLPSSRRVVLSTGGSFETDEDVAYLVNMGKLSTSAKPPVRSTVPTEKVGVADSVSVTIEPATVAGKLLSDWSAWFASVKSDATVASKVSGDDFRALCKAYGVADSGSKTDMLARIRAHLLKT